MRFICPESSGATMPVAVHEETSGDFVTDRSEKLPQRLGRTPTLGVMTDWAGEPYQDGILKGFLEGAKAVGANVLCFVGGPLAPPENPSPRNVIYRLIGPQSVSAVTLFTSPLMHAVGRSGMEAFCIKYLQDIPHSSIGAALDGIPSVVVSNTSGIEHVVSHLVREHNHKRIAFVRGPMANDEAEVRYQTYVQTLKKFDLDVDPRLVVVGNFGENSGRAAVRNLAQTPGIAFEDLDAIVASNDFMAVGIGQELEALGIAVPHQIAVTGFDDVDEARLTASPLTTVRQPLEKMGKNAARDLLHWIQLGTIPKTIEIDTELIVRRSCGCSVNKGQSMQPHATESSHSFEAALLMRRQRILDTLTRAARGGLGMIGADWQAKLLNTFIAELRNEKPDAFRNTIEEYARKLLAHGLDVQVCRDVVDLLRGQLIPTLQSEAARLERAEEIFYLTQIALNDATQRGMMRDKLYLGRWVREIAYVCNSFSNTFDSNRLAQAIREHFPRIGLKNYFVVTYSEEYGPKRAELFVGSDAGCDISPTSGQDFDAGMLLPASLMDSISTGRAFAVLPLCCRDQCLGHALIEFSIEQSFSYGAVSEAIGIALYGSRLAAKC